MKCVGMKEVVVESGRWLCFTSQAAGLPSLSPCAVPREAELCQLHPPLPGCWWGLANGERGQGIYPPGSLPLWNCCTARNPLMRFLSGDALLTTALPRFHQLFFPLPRQACAPEDSHWRAAPSHLISPNPVQTAFNSTLLNSSMSYFECTTCFLPGPRRTWRKCK